MYIYIVVPKPIYDKPIRANTYTHARSPPIPTPPAPYTHVPATFL